MANELSGTWRCVYCEVDGEMLPTSYAADLEATYQGEAFSIKVAGKVEHEGTYTLNTKAEPHEITFLYSKSSRFELGKPRLGIFQVTGDTYKNCLEAKGTKAPSGFNTTAGSNSVMTILKKGPVETPQSGGSEKIKAATSRTLTIAW